MPATGAGQDPAGIRICRPAAGSSSRTRARTRRAWCPAPGCRAPAAGGSPAAPPARAASRCRFRRAGHATRSSRRTPPDTGAGDRWQPPGKDPCPPAAGQTPSPPWARAAIWRPPARPAGGAAGDPGCRGADPGCAARGSPAAPDGRTAGDPARRAGSPSRPPPPARGRGENAPPASSRSASGRGRGTPSGGPDPPRFPHFPHFAGWGRWRSGGWGAPRSGAWDRWAAAGAAACSRAPAGSGAPPGWPGRAVRWAAGWADPADPRPVAPPGRVGPDWADPAAGGESDSPDCRAGWAGSAVPCPPPPTSWASPVPACGAAAGGRCAGCSRADPPARRGWSPAHRSQAAGRVVEIAGRGDRSA